MNYFDTKKEAEAFARKVRKDYGIGRDWELRVCDTVGWKFFFERGPSWRLEYVETCSGRDPLKLTVLLGGDPVVARLAGRSLPAMVKRAKRLLKDHAD